jgi:peptidyl-prolyl cis-trans isomerase D
MLRGIRKASSNWVGKAIMATVMGVLIFSFAIWGVADVFKGFGQSTVAKFGNSEISVEQFRQLYNDRLQQIGRQIGRPLSSQQARAFGLDQQVLQQWVLESTMDEAARRMALGQTDADLVRIIQNDPSFAGVTGKFDPQRFAQVIRQYGFTEQRYLAEQRKLSLRRQIAGSISAGIEPPNSLLDALTRYRDETRSISYVKLDAAQAGTIDDPSPEVLASYFDERKALFRAPEYRKLAILTLSAQDQAKWLNISDDEARKAYEATRTRYETPEKRRVEQIVFPNAEEAAKARETLVGGASFEEMAKGRGLSPADYDLGVVTKSGIIDSAVADAAFALAENEITQPVQGRFGTVLAKVTKIEPGITPSYESLAPQLKSEIAVERARASVRDIHNKMEDERGGGAGVTEAGQKLSLPVTTIEAVDRSGRAPDGGPASGLPQGIDVVAAAFTAEVGSDNDAIQINRPGDTGYVWYDVLSVAPSRERTLDEVKDQVLARWKNDQIAGRLKVKSDEMVEALRKGGKLDELAKAASLSVEKAGPFKRGATVPGVNAAGVENIFTLAKDEAGQSDGAGPNERAVYVVTDIVEPTVDLAGAQTKELRDNIKRTVSDEQVAQFVAKLESEVGAKINQAALAQATGAASSNN